MCLLLYISASLQGMVHSKEEIIIGHINQFEFCGSSFFASSYIHFATASPFLPGLMLPNITAIFVILKSHDYLGNIYTEFKKLNTATNRNKIYGEVVN